MRRPRPTPAASGRLGVAVVAAAVALLSACSPRGRRASAASNEPAVVVFENQALSEAAVYVVPRGGSQIRIGTVQAGRTDTLTVARSALGGSGTVTIVARLFTINRSPNTGPLNLLPGERVAVTLPPDARLLSVLPIRQ
jgi:hypothetical protein